jgi:hypothetical protein
LKCRQCSEQDLGTEEAGKHERLLAYLLPLQPYRCTACEHRQLGLASPVLTKPRIITYSALAGLILVVLVWGLLGGGEPPAQQPREEDVPSAASEKDVPAGPSPVAAERADPKPARESPPVLRFEEPPAEPSAPITISPFVAEQLARNRARLENGAPPPAPEPVAKAAEPVPPVTATAGGRLTAVTLSRAEDGALSVDLIGSGDFSAYSDLDMGDRLVVDLSGTWQLSAGITDTYSADHPLVRQLRVGRHADHLRLVFDLTDGSRARVRFENRDEGLRLRIEAP